MNSCSEGGWEKLGGVGKYEKKSGNLAELCPNFEELGGIWENHQTLSPKIVNWGGMGIVGNRVANFRKNGVRGPPTIRDGRVGAKTLMEIAHLFI